MVTSLLLALVLAPSSTQDRVFNELLSVHPYSVPHAVGTDSGGDTLLVAEGGSLAIVSDASSPFTDWGSADRHPVLEGAIPVAILLDPEADLTNGVDDAHDLAYLACGRFGLRVMNVGDVQGAGPSALIDDSGNMNPVVQGSRRWCNDLATMTVDTPLVGGGTELRTYLVTLFGKQDGTRLRVYDLEDARAVLGTGQPIAPLQNVIIKDNPYRGTEAGSAYGYGIAVDDTPVDDGTLDPLPGQAIVYVAAGAQGLARVEFTSTNILINQTGPGQVPPTAEWGPVFGTGTYHAGLDTRWENFEWIDEDDVVQRSDPPFFLDVVVDRQDEVLDIYTAHDQHGWVRFRHVSGTGGIAFSPSMPIQHHEGKAKNNPWGGTQYSVAYEPGTNITDFTYVQRLELLPVAGGPSLLVVGSSCSARMSVSAFLADEGNVLDFTGAKQGGVPGELLAAVDGANPYVCVYDTGGTFTANEINSDRSYPTGGSQLAVPSVQAITYSQTHGGELVVLAGQEVLITVPERLLLQGATARIVFDLDTTNDVTVTHERKNEDRPGKFTKGAATSLPDKDYLTFASNDGGRADDGPLVLCSNAFELVPTPTSPTVLFTLGTLMDPDGQWAGPSGTFHATGGAGPRLAVRRVEPGDPCGMTAPTVVRHWNIEELPDRFAYVGRKYFQGHLDEAFDEYLDNINAPAEGLPPWLIVTAMGRESVNIYDRALLEEALGAVATDGDTTIPLLELEVSGQSIPLGSPLRSHPEFQNVDTNDTQNHGDVFITHHKLSGSVQTFPPRLLQLASEGSSSRDTWVLGMPCGTLFFPPDLIIESSAPDTWGPDAPFDQFTHALVQFWDVSDPENIGVVINDVDGYADLEPIISGTPGSNAFGIEILEIESRTFCCLLDFGGRLEVWEVTNLLKTTGNEPALVATHAVTESMMDDLPNNATCLVTDTTLDLGVPPVPQTYIYLGANRLGIDVLRFTPGAQVGGPGDLDLRETIQTPGNVWDLFIRESSGEKTLIVSDLNGGLRLYGYNQNP